MRASFLTNMLSGPLLRLFPSISLLFRLVRAL